MADKYINEVGVGIIRDWANGKFALDTDLDALDAKVDEIVAEGGEPNVIETVKVNGTALTPDAQKAVDVPVLELQQYGPTPGAGMTIGSTTAGKKGITFGPLTNNTINITTNHEEGTVGYSANLATTDYVDANGGKIDVIKVNGTAQTITNKEVDLSIPVKTSDLTNDSNFQNDTQVDAKIDAKIASAVTLKGSVATYSALPATGQKHGDMYDVLDTGKNYVWIVEEGTGRWDDYAGTMDMSAYWTSTSGQTNTLEAMTVAEVNAILNPSA